MTNLCPACGEVPIAPGHLRAGIKFAAFIPHEAHAKVNQAFKEKGTDIDLARITPQDLEEIVSDLDDMTIEVDGKDKVRIFCE